VQSAAIFFREERLMKNNSNENIYYVGPEREHKSLTKLFLMLKDDKNEKIIYVDAGVYDIFKEYKEAGIDSPPDDVSVSDYFSYNAFLPLNTKLIGIGNVCLEFSPAPQEITYGESITWAPLNVLGECYVENIEIRCKNGRYCIHDDSHNRYTNVNHYYKHVRCIYELGDIKDGKRLGLENTIGFGFAQGCKFEFDSCTFRFVGEGDHAAFYGHDDGSENSENAPSIILKNCHILGNHDNAHALTLQNLAIPGVDRIDTRIESCHIQGGIYLTIYHDIGKQHFDVTLINSGAPAQKIEKPDKNPYPVKVFMN
jgi:hypothetical protein